MGRRALASAMVSISPGRPDLTPRLAAIRCPRRSSRTATTRGGHPDQAEAKMRLLAIGTATVIPGILTTADGTATAPRTGPPRSPGHLGEPARPSRQLLGTGWPSFSRAEVRRARG